MIKTFKCVNSHQIIAAARCGMELSATIKEQKNAIPEINPEINIKRKKDDNRVFFSPKIDHNEAIRKRLISYYGEPNQKNYRLKKSL